MSKVAVIPMYIQLQLASWSSKGHNVHGLPPWADSEKVRNWGRRAEALLREHGGGEVAHLSVDSDGRIEVWGVPDGARRDLLAFASQLFLGVLATDVATAARDNGQRNLVVGVAWG